MKFTIAVAVVALTSGIAMLAAPGQDHPGQITKASVSIDNRGSEEAIPVVVHGIAVTSPIPVHQTRQVWEYQTIRLNASDDAARSLAALGADGWEATGVLLYDATHATVLLKRPQ
jgi:hypothetical protein